jgi:hypothetical protein
VATVAPNDFGKVIRNGIDLSHTITYKRPRGKRELTICLRRCDCRGPVAGAIVFRLRAGCQRNSRRGPIGKDGANGAIVLIVTTGPGGKSWTLRN